MYSKSADRWFAGFSSPPLAIPISGPLPLGSGTRRPCTQTLDAAYVHSGDPADLGAARYLPSREPARVPTPLGSPRRVASTKHDRVGLCRWLPLGLVPTQAVLANCDRESLAHSFVLNDGGPQQSMYDRFAVRRPDNGFCRFSSANPP